MVGCMAGSCTSFPLWPQSGFPLQLCSLLRTELTAKSLPGSYAKCQPRCALCWGIAITKYPRTAPGLPIGRPCARRDQALDAILTPMMASRCDAFSTSISTNTSKASLMGTGKCPPRASWSLNALRQGLPWPINSLFCIALSKICLCALVSKPFSNQLEHLFVKKVTSEPVFEVSLSSSARRGSTRARVL